MNKVIFAILSVSSFTACLKPTEFETLYAIKQKACTSANKNDLDKINSSIESLSNERIIIYFLLARAEIEICLNDLEGAELSLSTSKIILKDNGDLKELICDGFITLAKKHADKAKFHEAYRIINLSEFCDQSRLALVKDTIYRLEINNK